MWARRLAPFALLVLEQVDRHELELDREVPVTDMQVALRLYKRVSATGGAVAVTCRY